MTKRPPRNPVIAIRVHPHLYEDIKRCAEVGLITMSEEAARRLGVNRRKPEPGCPCECCYTPPSYEAWFE
jgi:hypothetical protein